MYNIANKKSSVKFDIAWQQKKGFFFLFMKTKEIEMLEARCSFGFFFLLFKIELDSNPPFFIFDRKKSFSAAQGIVV